MASKEQATTIKLDEEDIRTGLTFAGEARMAQARVQAVTELEQAYIRRIAEKYKIDPTLYQIRDWVTGFELIQRAQE